MVGYSWVHAKGRYLRSVVPRAAALSVLFSTHPSAAQQTSMDGAATQSAGQSEIVVRYSGPRDCSSAQDFILRAAPRLPSLRLVETGRDVGLEVILVPEGDGVSAELVIHLEGGGTLSRSILASSCDEATEAIAFVASVALDPGAPKPVLVQTAGPAPDELDPALSDSEHSRLQAEEARRDSKQGRRRARSGETGSRGLLGVGAALAFGVAPKAMVGPDVSLNWSSVAPGTWSPALIVRAQYLLLEGHREPAGVASFHQGRMGLELCPSSFRVGIFSGRPCLGLAGGWVESQGSETESAGEATRPYVDSHLGGQLQLALGRQSAVLLSGYVALPWIRDSYQFDSTVFYRTSALTGGIALSIGARLW